MQAAKLSPLMSGGFLVRLEFDRILVFKPRLNANCVIEILAGFSPLLDLTAFAEESKLSGIELILSTLALAALLVQAPDAKLDKLRE